MFQGNSINIPVPTVPKIPQAFHSLSGTVPIRTIFNKIGQVDNVTSVMLSYQRIQLYLSQAESNFHQSNCGGRRISGYRDSDSGLNFLFNLLGKVCCISSSPLYQEAWGTQLTKKKSFFAHYEIKWTYCYLL